MKFSTLKINAAAAIEGDWIDKLPGFGDFRVRIASLDSRKAQAYSRDLYRKVLGRKRSRSGSIPPEITDYVTAKTLIDVCVSDWQNAELPVDKDGAVNLDEPVEERLTPYSREALAALLLQPAAEGVIITTPAPGETPQKFSTPDGMEVRFDMRELLIGLTAAADETTIPDDAEKN